jgi:hypothetical protein
LQVEAGFFEYGPVEQRRQESVLGEFSEACLIGPGKKAPRQQNAELGVADARQRLGAGEEFTLQVDLGLIPDLQPSEAKRFRQ